MTHQAVTASPPVSFGSGDFQMVSLNEVRLSGRLVDDPALRSAIFGKVAIHLNVAVNRKYRGNDGKWRKEVAFVPVTMWNSMADYMESRLRKGTSLYIEGRLHTDTWKSLDGTLHSALKVQASRVQAMRRLKPLSDPIPPAARLN